MEALVAVLIFDVEGRLTSSGNVTARGCTSWDFVGVDAVGSKIALAVLLLYKIKQSYLWHTIHATIS